MQLDGLGASLATLGLGALVYGLIESSHLGFAHPQVFATLIVGALSLATFIIVESRSTIRCCRLPCFVQGIFAEPIC